MRAIWNGSLSFGLVNIPIRLYSAVETDTLTFDLLHKKDMSPIRYARVCKQEEKEVPYEEIVKGYEYFEGEYVPLEKEDFEKANIRKTKTIDIVNFAKLSEINSVYFEKPYFLEANKSDKPYALLREALQITGKVAVAKYVIREKEHLAVIKPQGEFLMLNQLRFQEELRTPEELSPPSESELRNEELQMAISLINQMTEDFHPEEYHDTYKEELREVIKDKSQGRVLVQKGEEPTPTPVKDLMEVLKASLEQKAK